VRLIALLTVPIFATLVVALPHSARRKGGVHVETESGTMPLRFVAILSPGRAGPPDTVRAQTPADVSLHPMVRQLNIRSEDPHRRVWVRGGASSPSLYQLVGAAGTRVVLGVVRGELTPIAVE
jgi:hypothetical protein